MKKKEHKQPDNKGKDDEPHALKRSMWVDHRMETEQAEARLYELNQQNKEKMDQLAHPTPNDGSLSGHQDITELRKQVVEQLKQELKLKAAVSLYMDTIMVTLPEAGVASEVEQIAGQVQRIVDRMSSDSAQQLTVLVTTDKGHEEQVVKISKSRN